MTRAEAIQRLADRSPVWDVLVIGGGATGLGVAVDAASRGFQTLLLEQHDFAKATSSRSTKLIHGGFRYLKQGNVHLVRESLRERGLLLRNAPHLVHPLRFVVPAYHWWEKPWYGAGLKLYDAMSGRLSLGASVILSRDEALRELPGVNPTNLRGGVRYFDGQFDDTRLALCLAQTIFDHGGVAVNYCRVIRLLKENGRICGVIARDEETDRDFEIHARVVVNATGIFTDALRLADDPQTRPMMTVSQGAHLVLDHSFLPGGTALMVPQTDDGRVLFAIPWHGRVLVGTTDTPVQEPSLEPVAMRAEIDFLLEHAGRYLARQPTQNDIRSIFAGLRPLAKGGGKTSSIARDHVLAVSSSGLVTITGGKWTTYRKMAEDTVNKAIEVGRLESRPCQTMELALHGAGNGSRKSEVRGQKLEVRNQQPDGSTGEWDLSVYGADAAAVQSLARERMEGNERLHPMLPYRAAEVVWAVRQEMACTVEDVLARRLRALALDARAALECAPRVAAMMARELARDSGWQTREVERFKQLAAAHSPPGTGQA